jgi:stress response protein YsnF
MSKTVVALFNNSNEAQQAIDTLIDEGFDRTSVDLSNSNSNTSYSNDSTGYNDSNRDTNESGISRFFNSLFGDNDEADKYSKVAQRNSCVVTVHATSSEEAQRAADILDASGAMDVNEKAQEYGYGTTGTNINKDSMDTRSGNDSTSIPIVEENVQVGKREVETGGVRLRSRIVEKPVEENLRLREERVTVERTPVDRTATDEDLNSFQETDIEVVEHAEVPVVSKEVRVVEEVKLNKEVEHRDETVKETVRKTEVDVENIKGKGKEKRKGNSDTDYNE